MDLSSRTMAGNRISNVVPMVWSVVNKRTKQRPIPLYVVKSFSKRSTMRDKHLARELATWRMLNGEVVQCSVRHVSLAELTGPDCDSL